MKCTGRFGLAAAMLAGSASGYADPPKPAVVAIRYLVAEQSAERLEMTVVAPLERMLVALPRISDLHSTARHGSVDVEIGFEGGATEEDLETVTRRIEEFAPASEIVVTSRTVSLASPRL